MASVLIAETSLNRASQVEMPPRSRALGTPGLSRASQTTLQTRKCLGFKKEHQRDHNGAKKPPRHCHRASEPMKLVLLSDLHLAVHLLTLSTPDADAAVPTGDPRT